MKTNKLIFMSMMALATMLSACSNEDEEVAGNGNGNGGNTPATAVFTASAPGDGAAANSRIAMEENDPTNKNAGLKSTWQAKDKFVVVNLTKSDTIDFTTGTIDAAATYTTMVPSYTTNKMDSWSNGDQLCAYYYGNSTASAFLTSIGTDGLVNINLKNGQNGTLETLAKNTLLYSSTISFNKTGTNKFDFYHALSYLRVKVHVDLSKNPATTQISNILITKSDGGDVLTNVKATAANVAAGSWTSNGGAATSVTLANKAVDSNGDLFAYIAVVPQTLSDGFMVTATSATQERDGNNAYGYAAGLGTSVSLAKGKIRTIGGSTWKSAYEWIDENYYTWDTYDYVGAMTANDRNKNLSDGYQLATYSYNANTTYTSYAKYQCKNMPTLARMSAIYSAGVYWDDGSHGNPQSYEVFAPIQVGGDYLNPKYIYKYCIYKAGVWLKVTQTTNIGNVTIVDLDNKMGSHWDYLMKQGSQFGQPGWQFFPAMGVYKSITNKITGLGTEAAFWTSGKSTDTVPTTPASNITGRTQWVASITASEAQCTGCDIDYGVPVYKYW